MLPSVRLVGNDADLALRRGQHERLLQRLDADSRQPRPLPFLALLAVGNCLHWIT